MSLIAKPPAAPEEIAPPPAAPARPPATRRQVWAAVALAVAALSASGALRLYQGRRIDAAMRSGRTSPFPLGELPLRIGPWEGVVEELDPTIARATGSTDHTFRSYKDTRTGVQVGVIILYGPAADVFIHAPDNCYPAQGYALAEGPEARTIDAGGRPATFHDAVYVKGQGGQSDRQEVYHSWYYGGRWTPQLPVLKQAERIPGMLKVHVTRPTLEGEFRGTGSADAGAGPANPSEDFLARLMPEIQRRLDEAAAAGRAPAGR